MELQIALQENHGQPLLGLGNLSPFSCPECNGVLSAIKDGNIVRYRCHTGHAFSADTLLASITEKTEESLWVALREMQETAVLLNHIGDHYAEYNDPHEAAQYFQKAKEALKHGQLVKSILHNHEQASMEETESMDKPEVEDQQLSTHK